MKAVLILHNEAIDGEITELLKSAGIEHYTKFTNVLARGNCPGRIWVRRSGPKKITAR